MSGTTKAIWGAAALISGVTVITSVLLYDAIDKSNKRYSSYILSELRRY